MIAPDDAPIASSRRGGARKAGRQTYRDARGRDGWADSALDQPPGACCQGPVMAPTGGASTTRRGGGGGNQTIERRTPRDDGLVRVSNLAVTCLPPPPRPTCADEFHQTTTGSVIRLDATCFGRASGVRHGREMLAPSDFGLAATLRWMWSSHNRIIKDSHPSSGSMATIRAHGVA